MYYTENNHNKVVLRDFYLSKFENGPITEPCGTPEYLGKILLLWLCFINTFIPLSVIQLHVFPLGLLFDVSTSPGAYFTFWVLYLLFLLKIVICQGMTVIIKNSHEIRWNTYTELKAPYSSPPSFSYSLISCVLSRSSLEVCARATWSA